MLREEEVEGGADPEVPLPAAEENVADGDDSDSSTSDEDASESSEDSEGDAVNAEADLKAFRTILVE